MTIFLDGVKTMIFSYVSVHYNNLEQVVAVINQYANTHKLDIDRFVQDQASNTVNWQERDLKSLVLQDMDVNDTLIIYEASNIGRSTQQVLECLELIRQKSITLHLVKYSQIFPGEDEVDTQRFLELIQHIDSDFVAKRTTEAMQRRRAAGLNVGRPKGRKNNSLKLDPLAKDIQKYLDLNISRASIAKLLGCHPQTLYNYIEKKKMRRS